jgi:hypothetical protein
MIAVLYEDRACSTKVDHIIRAEIYVAAHGGDYPWFYENLQGMLRRSRAQDADRELLAVCASIYGTYE